MHRAAAEQFAREWVAAWNALDIEAIVAHFAEEATFVSPRAAVAVGTATVVGRAALAAYWHSRLAVIASLQFTLDHTVWDAERGELAIVYVSAVNGQRVRACEFMRFDEAGQVAYGEALYGAAV